MTGSMAGRRLAVFVGSTRKESINGKLAAALIALGAGRLQCDVVRIDDLPLYNQDHDQSPPEPVARMKTRIAAAEALLFVTPEHNRSVTSVLKNALDWGSRPRGKNSWAGKPAAVVGTSVSVLGSSMAQQHLRNILAYLDVPTLGQPEVFLHFTQGLIDADGAIANDGTRQFLQTFVERFAAFVDTMRPA